MTDRRRHADRDLFRSLRLDDVGDEPLRRAVRALSALGATLDAAAEATDEQELLDQACEVIVRDCGYRLAWVGYRCDDPDHKVAVAAESGYDDGYLASADIRWSDTERGRGPTGTAIRTGEPVIARHITTDPRFAPWRAQAVQRGYASSLALPLGTDVPARGALNIYAAEPDAFDDDEVAFLTRLAARIDYGITTLRTRQERERTAEELQATAAVLRALYDASPDMVFIHGPDGRLLDVNESALACYGATREQMLTALPGFFMGADCDIEEAMRRIASARGGQSEDFEWVGRRADGREFPIEVRLRPLDAPGEGAVLAVVRDLSDAKRAEREQLRAQKLESLGLFVGGVAHDFNNLLTGILMNLSFAHRKLVSDDDTSRVAGILTEAEQATLRASELTRQLLTFAKQHQPARKPTDVRPLVDDSVRFALSGTAIETRFDVPADIWAVSVDAGQIAQVLHNIALNGAQAMDGRGTMAITARNVTMPDDRGEPPRAERYVEIALENDGPRIPAADLERIFDPYYTTKERGSGLGLATAYSIVAAHGGRIRVSSSDEVTRFRILLPATKRAAEVDTAAPRATAPTTGRVLVMDDDDAIRSAAAEVLRGAGHEVALARTGEEAATLYERALSAGRRFDLVILDLTVRGGSGGVEALELLRRVDPDVRAAASTGYSASTKLSDSAALGFIDTLPKPYGADALLALADRHVRRV